MSSPKTGLSSKASQMRQQLQAKAKDREHFEQKNKSLLAEMETEKQKLGTIRQGLRNNEVTYMPPEEMASSKPPEGSSPMSSSKGITHETSSQSLNNSLHSVNSSPSHKNLAPKKTAASISKTSTSSMSNQNLRPPAIPSGPKISDWCYTGALDSQPPTVKANTLYETIRLLGRGAFGDVNLVKIPGENKLFACKTIFSEKESNMISTLEEVRFLRANRHPCIIDVYDIFLTEKPRILHIVMPFCEAGDLANQITTAKKNNSSIPEASILKWMMQVGLALQHLHHNNTIHRDIKPNNVMLTDGGDLAKLADFGLALELKSGRCESTAECGTPLYYSPEMVKGLPYAFPADCWSFGVMLHELLSLGRPFNGNSTADLANAIMNEKPPPIPSHYSQEMRNLVDALLIKDPAERLTLTQMLNDTMFSGRVLQFANSGYRPKMLEERLRRAHVRQLMAQIDQITRSGAGQASISAQSLDSVIEDAIPVNDVVDDFSPMSPGETTPPLIDVAQEANLKEDSEDHRILAVGEDTKPSKQAAGYYIQKDAMVVSEVSLTRHATPLPSDLMVSDQGAKEPTLVAIQEEGLERGENLEEILLSTPYGGKKGQAIAQALEFSSSVEEELKSEEE